MPPIMEVDASLEQQIQAHLNWKALKKKEKVRQPLFTWSTFVPKCLVAIKTMCAMTAINCAMNERYQPAVAFLVLAGVIEGPLLGWLMFGGGRRGRSDDGYSNFASFGVAPAIILYCWSFRQLDHIGWLVSLLCIVAAQIRADRKMLEPDANAENAFYSGLPAPAAAWLLMVPLIADFLRGGVGLNDVTITIPYSIGVCALMLSAVPTFSWSQLDKSWFTPGGVRILFTLWAVAITFVLTLVFRWTALYTLVSTLLGVYVTSMPISFFVYERQKTLAKFKAAVLKQQ